MGTARPLGSRTPNWAVMEHVAMGCHLHTMAGQWRGTWLWVVTSVPVDDGGTRGHGLSPMDIRAAGTWEPPARWLALQEVPECFPSGSKSLAGPREHSQPLPASLSHRTRGGPGVVAEGSDLAGLCRAEVFGQGRGSSAFSRREGEAGCISVLRGECSEITQASWILNPRCLFGRRSAGFSIVQGLQMGVGWLLGDGSRFTWGDCIGRQRHCTRTAWDSAGLRHTAAWRVLGSTGGEWDGSRWRQDWGCCQSLLVSSWRLWKEQLVDDTAQKRDRGLV